MLDLVLCFTNSMKIKYCIEHREGTNIWVVKEWVRSRNLLSLSRIVGSGGRFEVVASFGSEGAAIKHMRSIAEPSYSYSWFDKTGHENLSW